MTTKRLIVNADDYGLSPAVSAGIRAAHLDGIVTSTTVMITTPGVEADIAEAQRSTPHLGLGLHLVLAGGFCLPALPDVPSLLRPDGYFYDEPEWGRINEGFDADEITRELQAQFDRFVQVVGKPPTHLDSHYHAAYRNPAAFAAMVDLAARHDLPIRNPGFELPPLEQRPRYPDSLVGLRHTMSPAEVVQLLTGIPDGVTELLCHPGYVDDALCAADAYVEGRPLEVELLTHHEVIAAAQAFTLQNFSQLA